MLGKAGVLTLRGGDFIGLSSSLTLLFILDFASIGFHSGTINFLRF